MSLSVYYLNPDVCTHVREITYILNSKQISKFTESIDVTLKLFSVVFRRKKVLV